MGGIWVKICGIATLEDASCAVDAGADAIGLNLVAGSPRRIEPSLARSIARAVAEKVTPVAVVAIQTEAEARKLREETGISWLQLHGREPPDLLAALLPDAFKAVRIGDARDVTEAGAYAGDRLLADAKVTGALGGSGKTFDWSLVSALAAERRLVLAGGLTAENVAEAIVAVRPWGVDTASGVEQPGNPRRKDPARILAFVRAARGAGR